MVHGKENLSNLGRRMGAVVEGDQSAIFGIEGRNPFKSGVLTAEFGGNFPCNLR